MKKLTALFLAVLMTFSLTVVAFGAEAEVKEKCPVIFIAGSSIKITDADDNVISTGFDVLTDDDEGDMTKDDIIESAVNIILPFVLEGLPKDKWDTYGQALYDELAPIWDETQLDGNGNAKYGTGISKSESRSHEEKAATVNTGADGTFGSQDYRFIYDWRLSPYDEVDRLHEFIKTVIKTTGCSKVALLGRCLGGNIITAYLDKYGSEKLVKKVVYDEVMSNGSIAISEIFSGQIKFSDKHIQAYLLQSEAYGVEGHGLDLQDVDSILLEVVQRTYDLLTQTGASQEILDGVGELYEMVYEAFLPSMLLATGIGTWLSYWASVLEEDLDMAIDLIFGKEGTERRAEYTGLIEKIYYIRERISIPRTLEGKDNLYKRFEKDYGVEFAVIAGYGLMNVPMVESQDETSDCTVDTRCSSFGATTAGIFDTLPQDYIDRRVAQGLGNHISPDGKIDTSTCIFPETTWIIKNKHHDTFKAVRELTEYFTQYTNVTADSNKRNVSRFLICDKLSSEYAVNMTEDNCQDGPWLTDVEQKPTTETKLASLMRFFTTILNFLRRLFTGELILDLFD